MNFKWCSKCDREKRQDEFAASSSTPDGFQRWCRDCKSRLPARPLLPLAEPVCEQECGRCHETLPAGDFSYRKKRSPEFGLQKYCKDCMRIYKRDLRQAPSLEIFERQQRELVKRDRYEIENARKRGEL